MSQLKFIYLLIRRLLSSPRSFLTDYFLVRNSRIFDSNFYLTSFLPEHVRWIRRAPVLHYLLIGEPGNLTPNPLFNPIFYRDQLPTAVEYTSLLAHYISRGSLGSFKPNRVFAGLYYVTRYPDVLTSGQHPLAHFYWSGWKEGRDPHPDFITLNYLKKHGIDPQTGINPLVHLFEHERHQMTECSGLKAGLKSEALSADIQTSKSKLTVDLIIPVYRRPDCVENLLESLLASPDWEYVNSCIIVDDCGDSFTTEFLKAFPEQSSKIQLFKNDSNLGFLRSVNKAFTQAKSEVVILVNSDIQVPKNWLPRLIKPLENDNSVALVTPFATSGANLSVLLRPGQSWIEADRIISSHVPSYPDACTAIGYLMAIRKDAIKTPKLFDEVFLHGYGEDTDLHYRLLSANWKSVVCDNLLVMHKGSASYLLEDQKAKIYDHNRKIFFERWGDVHRIKHAQFVADRRINQVLTASSHTIGEFSNQSIDLLFVSPTNNQNIGGVKIIFEMTAYLCEHGISAKIFCLDQGVNASEHSQDTVMPIFLDSTLKRVVTGAKIIIGTGVGTAAVTKNLVRHYGAKQGWLVQGPECYFGAGDHFQLFANELRQTSYILTVSQYLTNLIKDFGIEPACTLPLGPDHMVFYPRDVKRKEKSIVIHLIDTPDKGSRFAISFAIEAKKQGMSVEFFGNSRLANAIPKDLGTMHGSLDSDGLAKLFSSCEYYLDLSFMEGLGLLPLEAAMCGCIPVMTRKGAPELIFEGFPNVIWLDSHLDYKRGIDTIKSFVINGGTKSSSLRVKYNSRKAYGYALNYFREILSKDSLKQ